MLPFFQFSREMSAVKDDSNRYFTGLTIGVSHSCIIRMETSHPNLVFRLPLFPIYLVFPVLCKKNYLVY